jgi:hypothetical protein
MDMNSKMDGSAPVSHIFDGVWKIQKKPSTDDRSKDVRKKNSGKKEEEKNFEDGRITDDNEMIMNADAPENNEDDKSEKASEDEGSPAPHKIDIVI